MPQKREEVQHFSKINPTFFVGRFLCFLRCKFCVLREAARRYKIHGYVSLTFPWIYGIMFPLIRYLVGVTTEISTAMICGRFVVDHSFDHLRLRTTWKQCEQEYSKAPFSDLKARKKRKNHAKNRYRFVWDVDAAGSNPVTPTIASVHNFKNEHSLFFCLK